MICGGSFTGVEGIIKQRIGHKGMGFGAELGVNDARSVGELLRELRPEDLHQFGLIPEFIGRLPVIVTLEELTEEDLVRILTEPRNALVRQYQKLFGLERIELEFTEGAIKAVAQEAITNKSGARGLRSILENAMLDIMYEVPFLEGLQTCRITEEVIIDGKEPELVFEKKKSA